MATRKNRGNVSKGSKGRKNRTQKGGFIGALGRILGFSNNQDSKQSQNENGSQSQQQNQQKNGGSNNIPELRFGGKKKRGCRNK
jgi:hypothetical protein